MKKKENQFKYLNKKIYLNIRFKKKKIFRNL
jgi:hypothetical protein